MILTPAFWLILTLTTLSFWIVPQRFRLVVLTAASFTYLATVDLVSCLFLAVWGLASFHVAHAIAEERLSRRYLSSLILGLLGFLVYFKYVAPSIGSILIPLGISYYVFKVIHYTIEVSRKTITDRSLETFIAYLYLFPIFTAGPIERYDHFLANREQRFRIGLISEGLTRISLGLIKKFVIGTYLLEITAHYFGSLSDVLAHLSDMHSGELWVYMILVYLYVYMDFSAYSDIAIGAALLMGFRIMENFNFPIFAKNISDFWKRWHMTLARWCQAYVYLPILGATRNVYLGVFATFIVMGLWHAGAWGWVLWGCYHAFGVSIYLTWLRFKRAKRWQRILPVFGEVLAMVVTFLFVAASYSFTVIHGQATASDGIKLFAKLLFLNT